MRPRGVWWRMAVLVLGAGLVGCASVERDQYGGEFLDDAAITARVKARLAQELGSAALGISVETHNRVVLLSGFIDEPGQRERAVAAARGVAGVRDVKGEGLALTPRRR